MVKEIIRWRKWKISHLRWTDKRTLREKDYRRCGRLKNCIILLKRSLQKKIQGHGSQASGWNQVEIGFVECVRRQSVVCRSRRGERLQLRHSYNCLIDIHLSCDIQLSYMIQLSWDIQLSCDLYLTIFLGQTIILLHYNECMQQFALALLVDQVKEMLSICSDNWDTALDTTH